MQSLLYEKINDNEYKVIFSKEFYEKEAIFSAVYNAEKNFVLKVMPLDEYNVVVYLKAKVDNDILKEKYIQEFCNDVNDQQIYLDIEKRTYEIRKRIYEKAFDVIQR